MTHDEAVAAGLVERYLHGELEADTAERFEAHYFDCLECQEALEWSEDFAGAVRSAHQATGESLLRVRMAAAIAASVQRRRSRLLGWGLAGLGLFGVLLAGGGLWTKGQIDRDQASNARRLAAAQTALDGLERRADEAELQVEAERRRRLAVERELVALEETAKPDAPETSQALPGAAPRAETPSRVALFVLALSRSSELPSTVVDRSTLETSWLGLIADPPATNDINFQAVLRDARGRAVWTVGNLEVGALESIDLLVPADFLEPGEYRLTIESIPEGDRVEYRLLVVDGAD